MSHEESVVEDRENGDQELPLRQTVFLVNKFVAETADFLNSFAHTCDVSLQKTGRRLEELAAQLLILEAKLDSIPGVQDSNPESETKEQGFAFSPLQEPQRSPRRSRRLHKHMNSSPKEPTLSKSSETAIVPILEPSANKAPQESTSLTGGATIDPAHKKYVKLLQMGMPLEQVQHKVAVEAVAGGFDAAKLIQDLTKVHTALQTTNEGTKADDAPRAKEEDPALQKYRRMLKMGVPIESIKQKMKMDGVPDSDLL